MRLRQVVAAVPWVRQAWRLLPGPWRVPALVGGVAVWLWNRRRGPSPE